MRVRIQHPLPLVRHGLKVLLSAREGLEVVDDGEADVVIADTPVDGERTVVLVDDVASKSSGGVAWSDGFVGVVAALTGEASSPSGATDSSMTALSPRELEILSALAEGLTTADVASRLAISANTVEEHKRRVFSKLDVTSVSAAVAAAHRAGLLGGSL